ncbi:hypothetical protein F4777DRAFT_543575 [Nemania sp. FL0916]|nr:hypothetical protein F4777DRAFT_543575 [Nemania sp. FL0916]
MAFIRPYKDSDFDACAHICIETLPPTLAASSAAAELSPYVWTHPYTFLSPSTCHVLDDGTGKAVGYCIGCPDVHAFAAQYERYISDVLAPAVTRPSLDIRAPWVIVSGKDDRATTTMVNPIALAQTAYCVDWMLFDNKEAVTQRWRATMHIDLLPEWQGQGWGRKLIDRFVASVQSSGENYGEGEHIGVAGENSKVVPFYEKVGFRVIEGGESEGSIWMVRDIGRA